VIDDILDNVLHVDEWLNRWLCAVIGHKWSTNRRPVGGHIRYRHCSRCGLSEWRKMETR